MIKIQLNSILLIGVVVFLFLICLGIIIYIFYRDRKKDEEEIAELMDDIEKVEEKKMSKEVNEVGFVEKKSEIEEMLEKMQHDLEAKTEDVVEAFEQEQEEKSIISYQELVNSLKGKEAEPVTAIETKVDDLQKIVSEYNETTPELDEVVEEPTLEQPTQVKETKGKKKFKKTDFISPVYGKINEHIEYPTVQSLEKKEQVRFDFDNKEAELEIETKNIDDYLDEFDFKNNMEVDSLEQTLDMPPISSEIKKNDEFLQALKEFRKNLE